MPIQGDMDISEEKECMKKGVAILEKPENILPSGEQTWSSDTQGQFEDLWVEFFNDPDMSPQEAQARYVEIVENAD